MFSSIKRAKFSSIKKAKFSSIKKKGKELLFSSILLKSQLRVENPEEFKRNNYSAFFSLFSIFSLRSLSAMSRSMMRPERSMSI